MPQTFGAPGAVISPDPLLPLLQNANSADAPGRRTNAQVMCTVCEKMAADRDLRCLGALRLNLLLKVRSASSVLPSVSVVARREADRVP